MIQFDIIQSDAENPTSFSRDDVADFLFEHLDEYGDERKHILQAINYAFNGKAGQDGFLLVAFDKEQIVGAVVINHTNMGGYIPENILVYIAVDAAYRGQGIGKGLMERVIEVTDGDIALHVEPENPAKFLYEKYGFTNKYLEMRLKK
ncbi:MAG TPA: GNAT family N-acetyltransferase [Balneolaceae bacterium]|nr:GNAT family N-acetyltransferase [Balneolaceae bacterium]